MSDFLLPLATLLLLVTPFAVERNSRGAATARLLLGGFLLAAFRQGAGTLDLLDLRTIAAQSLNDAWFIGITAGAMLAGAAIGRPTRHWRGLIPGLPLAAGADLGGGASGRRFWSVSPSGLLQGCSALASTSVAGAVDRSLTVATSVLLPVIAVALHLVTVAAFPEWTLHWQPLVSAVAVLVALVAGFRARWDGAALAMTMV